MANLGTLNLAVRVFTSDYLDDEALYRNISPLITSHVINSSLTGDNYLFIKHPPYTFFSHSRANIPLEFAPGLKLKIVAYLSDRRCLVVEHEADFAIVPFEYFDLPDWIKVTNKLLS